MLDRSIPAIGSEKTRIAGGFREQTFGRQKSNTYY
jgi:hypothetical protein